MQTYISKRKTQDQATASTPESAPSRSEMLHLSGAGAPQPMSPQLREKFEPGFQADFTNIRISRGHIPEELGVQAVAQGTDILLDADAGMDVLGHELAHVVQQAQGRVEGGFPVVENASLEHEADVMGARAASGLTAQAGPQNGFGGESMEISPMSGASAPAQCKSRQEKKAERAQRAANKHEMDMLTAGVGQDGRSREEVFALQDERDAIQQRMSDQDLANLTPGQKQQADTLMKRGGAEASEREVDFQAAKARYEQGGTKQFQPKNTYYQRYLQRHLTGLDAGAQDEMFRAFAEDDRDAMAGYMRKDFLDFHTQVTGMQDQLHIGNNTEELLNVSDRLRSLNQDRMAPSDLVKIGVITPEQMGFSKKEFAKIQHTAKGYGSLFTLYQNRLKKMARGTPVKEDPAPAPQQAAPTSTSGRLFQQQMAQMRAQGPGSGAAQASDLGTPGQLDQAASRWVQQNLFGQAPAASGGQPIGVQQLIRPDWVDELPQSPGVGVAAAAGGASAAQQWAQTVQGSPDDKIKYDVSPEEEGRIMAAAVQSYDLPSISDEPEVKYFPKRRRRW